MTKDLKKEIKELNKEVLELESLKYIYIIELNSDFEEKLKKKGVKINLRYRVIVHSGDHKGVAAERYLGGAEE